MEVEERISILKILDFLGGNINSRCLVEGERVVDAKHIITCGLKKVDSATYTIFALCLQTSALTEAPHTITGQFLRKSTGLEIGKFTCTCKAGPGGDCKHIAAVLIYCNRNGVSFLDRISVTDQECQWKKIKSSVLSNYHPVPIQDFCCVTEAQPSIILSPELLAQFKEDVIRACPKSIIALHQKGQMKNVTHTESITQVTEMPTDWLSTIMTRDLVMEIHSSVPEMTVAEKDFFDQNVKLTENAAINLAKETVEQSDSELWHHERNIRITGTRCYPLFTYSKNKNPDWDQKIWSVLNNCFCGNSSTQHGIANEGNALEAYKLATGLDIMNTGLIVHPKFPFLGFSPDGIIICNNELILIEIKCPVAGKHSPAIQVVPSLKYICIKNGQYTLKDKHTYYGQAQLGMFLIGASKCHMVIYCPFDSSYVNIEIKKDEMFLRKLIPTLHEVYFKYMLPKLCKQVE